MMICWLTYEWSDCWSEDWAALYNEGHSSTHKHGKVSGDPAERGWQIYPYQCQCQKEQGDITESHIGMLLWRPTCCLFGSLDTWEAQLESKPFGSRYCQRLYGNQESSLVLDSVNPPVLMTFCIALATWPFSTEFSSLTSMIRQEHSTIREPASSISPTAKSGREESTNKWLPGWRNRGQCEV